MSNQTNGIWEGLYLENNTIVIRYQWMANYIDVNNHQIKA